MGQLLVCAEETDAVIALFEPELSPQGHNDCEAEEAIVVYWTKFIQKIEGIHTFITAQLALTYAVSAGLLGLLYVQLLRERLCVLPVMAMRSFCYNFLMCQCL